MRVTIGIIKGDGIGPEIVREAVRVLDTVAKLFHHEFIYKDIDLGGVSIDLHGEPLTQENITKAKTCDAILMGSIGGDARTSSWYQLPAHLRPEAGLLTIRQTLDLFCNLRPAILYDTLRHSTPLKDHIVEGGFDVLIVRELVGGLYFGEHIEEMVGEEAVARDMMSYSESEVRRIAIKAFEAARLRNKKVTSVDKANVIATSRLWRRVMDEVHLDYQDVTLEHMFVDNAAMQLVMNPKQFDVIVTENMFGDILSDEASVIAGSIGMLPSASLNASGFGLYEPSGGSAPDIAGQNIANPIATILSAAMMLEYSFGLKEEAKRVNEAIQAVLRDGYRTRDIYEEGNQLVGTDQMGELIAKKLHVSYET